MEQIRPFPPTDLIDRAEEEEAILLAPAVDLKEWVIKNWLTIGGELHNPDHDLYRGGYSKGRYLYFKNGILTSMQE